ncbi:unnamed protein product [Periconia digitata]|uniref:LysM domain-containing protein n=1 Tax=Periconia digitata TaxID=1303443 RepID=A0A9W4UDR4_9PLEO|nr:unnamed protein product [Periconia digitata]
MGRWADRESDAERLPEGFERVGYDADTQTYTFRDREGRYYESTSGNRYGTLRPINGGNAGRQSFSSEEESETEPMGSGFKAGDEEGLNGDSELAEWQIEARRNRRARRQLAGKNPFEDGNRQAVKMMLPFVLLVLVFLLVIFKFLMSVGADEAGSQIHCKEGFEKVEVQSDETCWAIAKAHGLSVADLLTLEGNEEIDCAVLQVGQQMCVPN